LTEIGKGIMALAPLPTTGFTAERLLALEEAIASGARSVSYEGKSVTYGSLDEMLRVRSIIRSALGLDPVSRTILVAHDRGFSGGRGEFGGFSGSDE
jgi:hypothetical protein